MFFNKISHLYNVKTLFSEFVLNYQVSESIFIRPKEFCIAAKNETKTLLNILFYTLAPADKLVHAIKKFNILYDLIKYSPYSPHKILRYCRQTIAREFLSLISVSFLACISIFEERPFSHIQSLQKPTTNHYGLFGNFFKLFYV